MFLRLRQLVFDGLIGPARDPSHWLCLYDKLENMEVLLGVFETLAF